MENVHQFGMDGHATMTSMSLEQLLKRFVQPMHMLDRCQDVYVRNIKSINKNLVNFEIFFIDHSKKECFADGTWNTQTDTAPCSKNPRLFARTRWHIAMLSISLIVCIPCIAILIVYKDLRTQKHSLIRNLIISIVMRNIFVLMIKDLVSK